MAWKTLVIIALGMLSVALVISIVSCSIPYWVTTKQVGSSKVWMGLWKICFKQSGKLDCTQIATSGWLKAVRAFVVLGIVATMVSLVMTTLHLRAEQVLYPAVGAASSAAAWLFFVIAVAIYGGEMKFPNSGGHFSSGYYLAVLSDITCLVATVLILVSWKSSRRGGYDVVP
ncbi:uncharacterized protein LOC128232563 [Mya arenaria]|uniref:uncharacterized protein LOC128232563 n=1 Tax=Mya arenaria TaxID=6604 RepID=UPI0022DFEAE2|nr:uncharacterized protein LOC128232563 [Mya arenaria]XP_052802162.1 uncharacterized protein LOC128232563 [Mya arenaria]XP_052802163.1 uncharacterized protein LOC128232563 [Mya arenaria]XP_052802165.1 uncharacterized protein LOC128232563 [Mya arenaria]